MSDTTTASKIHPQADTAALEQSNEPVATSYTMIPTARRVKSSCLGDTRDVGVLCMFPCEPMARASASVGHSYVGVFLSVALVYGGGIACMGTSAAVSHPLFEMSIGSAFLLGWILNMMGAVLAAPNVVFLWAFVSVAPYLDEDPTTKFDASDASMALVVLHFACQVVYIGVVMYLRHELLQRSQASSCCSSCLGGFCLTLFFPCCSYAEAMQRARAAQEQHAQNSNRDELPAYIP